MSISFFKDPRLPIAQNGLEDKVTELNFSLLYYHYPHWDKEDDFQFFWEEEEDKTRKNKKPKKIKTLFGHTMRSNTDQKAFFPSDKLEGLVKDQKAVVEGLFPSSSTCFDLEVDGSMAIGLGISSVYETGICLHHTYAVPYIPATAIKAVFRRYLEDEGNESLVSSWLGFSDEETKNAAKGKITFFDAFPTEVELAPDIINSHYPKWYSDGKTPPADWQSPVPVFFMSLKNAKFQIAFALKEDSKEDLEEIKTKLTQALQNHGLGAKTAVGYGFFK